jgi:hypothetical protein
MSVERRNYKRFITQDKTFVKLKSASSKVGKVNDIGIKGLGFSYLSESIGINSGSVSFRVDIYRKNEFYLTNVHCKVVYDIPDPTSDKNHSIMTRLCGLHFGEVSKIQLKLLNIFIKKYATEISS